MFFRAVRFSPSRFAAGKLESYVELEQISVASARIAANGAADDDDDDNDCGGDDDDDVDDDVSMKSTVRNNGARRC